MDLVQAILAWISGLAGAALAAYWLRALIEIEWTSRTVRTARDGLALAQRRPPSASVCVIVPAHNEEAVIGGLIESLKAQDYQAATFVLALDRCTDRTLEIAKAATAGDARFEIIVIDLCPADWAGKVHAAYSGFTRSARAQSAQRLIFADADTIFAPGCVRATLALRDEEDLHMLSLLSTLRSEKWFEHVAQPPAAMELLHQFPIRKANRIEKKRPFANGQFMLFTDEAYRHMGTHELVKGELLEDLMMAHVAECYKLRSGVYLADGMLLCRMYPTWAAFRRGWKRIFTEASHRRPARLRRFAWRTRVLGTFLPALTLLGVLVAVWIALREPREAIVLSVAVGAGMLLWVAGLLRIAALGRAAWWSVPSQIVGSWLVAGILREAACDLEKGNPIEWGGRRYLREGREGDDSSIVALAPSAMAEGHIPPTTPGPGVSR